MSRRPPEPPTTATVLPGSNPVPEFSLLNQHGDSIDESVFRGQWDLVFFGFTHCPDVCPVTLQVMNQTLKQLSPDEAQAVFISVDPERDSIEKIKLYVEFFNPDMTGATSTPEAIKALADHIGIIYQRTENPADKENYLVDHSASVLLINPRAELAAVLSPPLDAKTMAADLRTVKQLTLGR